MVICELGKRIYKIIRGIQCQRNSLIIICLRKGVIMEDETETLAISSLDSKRLINVLKIGAS